LATIVNAEGLADYDRAISPSGFSHVDALLVFAVSAIFFGAEWISPRLAKLAIHVNA